MEFIAEELLNYCEKHSSSEGVLLNKISRETNLKVMMPRMLSGHLQGQVLSMLSKMIKPKRILEIGTYTGYSAICLAAGLSENGKLITIDVNKELETQVRGYFLENGSSKIEYIIGNAIDVIPELNEKFDLVFIDADKQNYMNYYNLVFDKLTSGGFIFVDNVLWSGKVLLQENKMDKDTLALHEFNKKINLDNRVEKVILPIRDGITLIRKL